jgi:plasmid stability protein
VRRTQIYIDEQADEQLRQAAAAEGRSAAALIREALGAYLAARARELSPDDPILAMAGTLHGLPADASVEHDRDLYIRPIRRVGKERIARNR